VEDLAAPIAVEALLEIAEEETLRFPVLHLMVAKQPAFQAEYIIL
jgi:hypothetical protein